MANPFSNTKLATSKSDFLDVVNVLPEGYRELVKQGAVRLVDRSFYSVKALGNSTTKELMAASDTQKVGITNVNNRKMEASQYFLLKGIRIQTAKIAGTDEITDAKLAAADFTGDLNTDVANGDLEISVAGKTAFPRNAVSMFETTENVKGYIELDCPRLIAPQSEIIPVLHLAKAAGDGRVAVRITLVGTAMISA